MSEKGRTKGPRSSRSGGVKGEVGLGPCSSGTHPGLFLSVCWRASVWRLHSHEILSVFFCCFFWSSNSVFVLAGGQCLFISVLCQRGQLSQDLIAVYAPAAIRGKIADVSCRHPACRRKRHSYQRAPRYDNTVKMGVFRHATRSCPFRPQLRDSSFDVVAAAARSRKELLAHMPACTLLAQSNPLVACPIALSVSSLSVPCRFGWPCLGLG